MSETGNPQEEIAKLRSMLSEQQTAANALLGKIMNETPDVSETRERTHRDVHDFHGRDDLKPGDTKSVDPNLGDPKPGDTG